VRPEGRTVVALTGTDLYRDLPAGDPRARRSLEAADLLVGLHPGVAAGLPEEVRPRLRVILQSVELPPGLAPTWQPPAEDEPFQVAVAGHLRAVKDPFRTALALQSLPQEPPVRVQHLGAALEPGTAEEARRLETVEPRYRWLGERPRQEALAVLARSHLVVVSSRMEGGPNVLSEALALEVPVLATDVPGCTGLLGPDHPGLFPPEDTAALARLLRRARTDPSFHEALHLRSRELAHRFRPEQERAAWKRLLAELPGIGPRD
ncbi:MAG: glycosyltransferase, partial [Thermoanaerobaculia bacterium]